MLRYPYVLCCSCLVHVKVRVCFTKQISFTGQASIICLVFDSPSPTCCMLTCCGPVSTTLVLSGTTLHCALCLVFDSLPPICCTLTCCGPVATTLVLSGITAVPWRCSQSCRMRSTRCVPFGATSSTTKLLRARPRWRPPPPLSPTTVSRNQLVGLECQGGRLRVGSSAKRYARFSASSSSSGFSLLLSCNDTLF